MGEGIANDDGISGTYEGGGGQTYDLHNDNRGLVNTRKYGYVNGMDSKGIFKVNITSKDVTINDFIVSEFAGDNYALFAASDSTHLLNLENKDSSDLDKIYDISKGRVLPIDKGVKSNILTVWRLLHIEIDAMKDFEWHQNEIRSYARNFSTYQNTIAGLRNIEDLLSDKSLDQDSTTMGNGRFEKGTIAFSSFFQTLLNYSTVENNGSYRAKTIIGSDTSKALKVRNLPCRITKNGNPNYLAKLEYVNKLNDTTIHWKILTATLDLKSVTNLNNYINGKFKVIEDSTNCGMDILGFDLSKNLVITKNFCLPFAIRDDDKKGILPFGKAKMLANPTNLLDSINYTFSNAFVKPVFDAAGFPSHDEDDLDYIRNLWNKKEPGPDPTKTANDWSNIITKAQINNIEKDNFWGVHLMGSHQPTEGSDSDPNLEGTTFGITDPYNTLTNSRIIATGGSTSAVFRESWLEKPSSKSQTWVIIHEIGHQFGLSHGALSATVIEIPEANYSNKNHNMGIMAGAPIFRYNSQFIPRFQNLIRSRTKSPGQK